MTEADHQVRGPHPLFLAAFALTPSAFIPPAAALLDAGHYAAWFSLFVVCAELVGTLGFAGLALSLLERGDAPRDWPTVLLGILTASAALLAGASTAVTLIDLAS